MVDVDCVVDFSDVEVGEEQGHFTVSWNDEMALTDNKCKVFYNDGQETDAVIEDAVAARSVTYRFDLRKPQDIRCVEVHIRLYQTYELPDPLILVGNYQNSNRDCRLCKCADYPICLEVSEQYVESIEYEGRKGRTYLIIGVEGFLVGNDVNDLMSVINAECRLSGTMQYYDFSSGYDSVISLKDIDAEVNCERKLLLTSVPIESLLIHNSEIISTAVNVFTYQIPVGEYGDE